MLGLLNLVSPEAKQIKLYLDLMLNQLNFVLLFVEDLLDLQQIGKGTLHLAREVFNPT